ncbi:MAG TPA: Rho termination factor N-terminal domain-containing protein, partial [Anaerolineales bacterium]|nr:Rho termination factor N-terminal domain-containing protein [Anaerolineales bacterium]
MPAKEDAIDIIYLEKKSLGQLRDIANDWNITNYTKYKKDDLIVRLLRANAEKHNLELRGGVLEILDD